MARRFQLADLTPATRALYRAYRDAVAESRKLGTKMERAYALRQVPATTLWHYDRDPAAYTPEVRDRAVEQLRVLDEKSRAADAAWKAACERATAAFQAAVPAMESEGYRREWFNTPTGAVVLPAGVQSPGAHRPGRTHKVVGGDRVEITAGDEIGGWGIVHQVVGDDYHVGMYGSHFDVRLFERSEIRKSRS